MKRILITGGSGYLGALLVRALRAQYEVAVLGRNAGPTGSAWFECDIRDAAATSAVLREYAPDVVIHCAALSKLHECAERPLDCHAVNVTGSANVASAAIDSGASAVIGLSSDRVHQRDENVYGHSKSEMEQLFAELGRTQSATAFVSTRLGKVPGGPGSFLDHWSAAFRRDGVIRSTGPDHESFFLPPAAFVQHIALLIERASEWTGLVHVPDHKAARLRDILDVWIAEYGGNWEDDSEGPAPANSSVLISADESMRTRHEFSGELGFSLIGHESPGEANPRGALMTVDVPTLTSNEILGLIRTQDVERRVREERPHDRD